MFCKVCGKELVDGAVFCGNCGTKVERVVVDEKVETVVQTVAENVAKELEQEDKTIAEAITREFGQEDKTIAEAITRELEQEDKTIAEAVTREFAQDDKTVAEIADEVGINGMDDATVAFETIDDKVENIVEESVTVAAADKEPVTVPLEVGVPAENTDSVSTIPLAQDDIPTKAVNPVPIVPAPAVAPIPMAPITPVVRDADKVAAKDAVKAAKEEIKAARAAEKAERKRLMVKRNTVVSTIMCVFLSLVVTAVMFATTAVAVLCSADFNEFYDDFIIANLADFNTFWVLTSMWYLYALAAILTLLVLLILSLIKRRKYAIFNYIGIPMIINGAFFALVTLLNKWIVKTFDLPELFAELFEVIGDEAKTTVLFAGIILLSAGIFFVLLYVLIAVIHKAVYRNKRKKEEANQ